MAELGIDDLENELKTVREQNDTIGELRILRCLGSLFHEKRAFTKAASYLSKALKLVKENGSAEDKAVVHASLGCVYWEMAQLKKAMMQFQSSLEIQQQLQNVPAQADILTIMGISNWRECQWEEGFSYFHKVWELCQLQASTTAKTPDAREYSFLAEAIERGVVTLQNRIQLGREQDSPLKILQPLFSMIPLYLFTARKNQVGPLLQEATSLAEQLQKNDIQDAIPKLHAMIDKW